MNQDINRLEDNLINLSVNGCRTSQESSEMALVLNSCEFCRKPMHERSKLLKEWRSKDSKNELKSGNIFSQVTNACGTFRVNIHGSVTLLQPGGRARLSLSIRELQALASMDEEVNTDWDTELNADPSQMENYSRFSERELEKNEINCGGGSVFVVVPRKILWLVEQLTAL